jgi:hypothetical protein
MERFITEELVRARIQKQARLLLLRDGTIMTGLTLRPCLKFAILMNGLIQVASPHTARFAKRPAWLKVSPRG